MNGLTTVLNILKRGLQSCFVASRKRNSDLGQACRETSRFMTSTRISSGRERTEMRFPVVRLVMDIDLSWAGPSKWKGVLFSVGALQFFGAARLKKVQSRPPNTWRCRQARLWTLTTAKTRTTQSREPYFQRISKCPKIQSNTL